MDMRTPAGMSIRISGSMFTTYAARPEHVAVQKSLFVPRPAACQGAELGSEEAPPPTLAVKVQWAREQKSRLIDHHF